MPKSKRRGRKQKEFNLVSSDGESFFVDAAVALQSKRIMDQPNLKFYHIQAPSKVLVKVIEYCKKHVENPNDPSADDELANWDAEFLKNDQATLFRLICVAEGMGIRGLLDLTCQTVGDMIEGRTSKEISQTFGIKEELLPAGLSSKEITTSNIISGDYYEDSSDCDFDCDDDVDSDCESLRQKFDDKYGRNHRFKAEILTKEEEECVLCGLQIVEKYGESSSTTSVQDIKATHRNNRRKVVGDFEEIWTNWALTSQIEIVKNNIKAYNKARIFFFVHVAGFYGKNGGSGIGVLIRNRQGVPVAVFSHCDVAGPRVSAFYQEMSAALKGIDMSIELRLQYIQLICTSAEVAAAISECDRLSMEKEDSDIPVEPSRNESDDVYILCQQMTRKLQSLRKMQLDGMKFSFRFIVFPGGKLRNTPARCLARLKNSKGNMGPEDLSKQKDLMHYIYKDANELSDAGLFRQRFE